MSSGEVAQGMQLAARSLMPPPAPRPPRAADKQVLDEDTYTDAIEAIIERDFFPDVPKMKSQLEWLQAVKSGDAARIRQAQLNIAHRRAGLQTPSGAIIGGAAAGLGGQTPGMTPTATGRPGTGAWAATPGTNLLTRTPAMTPLVGAGGAPDATPGGGPSSSVAAAAAVLSAATGAQARAPPVSLDTYLSQFTSEDNASFAKVVEEEQKRKRLKMAHHLDQPEQQLLLTGPSGTDEYGTSGQQPMTLAFPKHNPTSNLYYYQGHVALSEQERAAQAIGPPKAVVASNTRLSASEQDSISAATEQARSSSAPPAGGAAFDRLATPSFTPGDGGFSPLMTWGELGSTPLRLEGTGPDDFEVVLPPGAGEGPFQVQALGAREQTLHKLAHTKAGKGQRKLSPALAMLQQARTQGRAGTPVLSPAARALASRLKGGAGTPLGVGTADRDDGLRASYRKAPSRASTPLVPGGSMSRQPSRASTPAIGHVGKAATARQAGQAGAPLAAAAAQAPGQSITDDLLKL